MKPSDIIGNMDDNLEILLEMEVIEIDPDFIKKTLENGTEDTLPRLKSIINRTGSEEQQKVLLETLLGMGERYALHGLQYVMEIAQDVPDELLLNLTRNLLSYATANDDLSTLREAVVVADNIKQSILEDSDRENLGKAYYTLALADENVKLFDKVIEYLSGTNSVEHANSLLTRGLNKEDWKMFEQGSEMLDRRWIHEKADLNPTVALMERFSSIDSYTALQKMSEFILGYGQGEILEKAIDYLQRAAEMAEETEEKMSLLDTLCSGGEKVRKQNLERATKLAETLAKEASSEPSFDHFIDIAETLHHGGYRQLAEEYYQGALQEDAGFDQLMATAEALKDRHLNVLTAECLDHAYQEADDEGKNQVFRQVVKWYCHHIFKENNEKASQLLAKAGREIFEKSKQGERKAIIEKLSAIKDQKAQKTAEELLEKLATGNTFSDRYEHADWCLSHSFPEKAEEQFAHALQVCGNFPNTVKVAKRLYEAASITPALDYFEQLLSKKAELEEYEKIADYLLNKVSESSPSEDERIDDLTERFYKKSLGKKKPAEKCILIGSRLLRKHGLTMALKFFDIAAEKAKSFKDYLAAYSPLITEVDTDYFAEDVTEMLLTGIKRYNPGAEDYHNALSLVENNKVPSEVLQIVSKIEEQTEGDEEVEEVLRRYSARASDNIAEAERRSKLPRPKPYRSPPPEIRNYHPTSEIIDLEGRLIRNSEQENRYSRIIDDYGTRPKGERKITDNLIKEYNIFNEKEESIYIIDNKYKY